MGTFLVTGRMSPALRARVAASVRGRRSALPEARRTRWRASLRLLSVALVIAAAWGVARARASVREEVERQRASLLARADAAAAGLGPREHSIVTRAGAWLERAAAPEHAEQSPVLAEAELAALLSRPTVYVRVPLASATTASRLRDSAPASFKDALVGCLLEPPASRSEKALLARARAVHKSTFARSTAHVARLSDAITGLPLLTSEWRARVLAANDTRELTSLVRHFERAPLAGARRAARAELLLYALDEPGDPALPAELDGERPHAVRVGAVDLTSDRLVFSVRRPVDPSWLSAAARAEYASGVDSCALALDVRRALTGASASRP